MDQPALNARVAPLAKRLEIVRGKIAAIGGDPEVIQIVAVTKGRDRCAVSAAVSAGLCALGENYAQELLEKLPGPPGARWHFIGQLQSNKVRRLAPHVVLWQSVDRRRLLTEIARHSPGAEILVQLAARSVPERGGTDPETARRLVAEAEELGLRPIGLMSMALPGPPSDLRGQFRALRRLADDLQLPVRSMGTSSDYLHAVQEGATLLRLGRVLFAELPTKEGSQRSSF